MAINTFGKIVKNVGTGILNRTVGRLFGSGITGNSNIKRATARWSGRADSQDWRVKLTVPNGPLTGFFDFDTNPLMQPLAGIGGIFWPLTPSMVIQHSANYNAMDMTHSNFPHQAYQNSQVDSLNIIGEYPVQNQDDAKHWVATVNFLRTATKMFLEHHVALSRTAGSHDFFTQQTDLLRDQLAEAAGLLRDQKTKYGIVTVEGTQTKLLQESSAV